MKDKILEFKHATAKEESAAKLTTSRSRSSWLTMKKTILRVALILTRLVSGTTCLGRTGWMKRVLLIFLLTQTASQKMTSKT